MVDENEQPSTKCHLNMIKILYCILIVFTVSTSCNFRTESMNDFYAYSKVGDLWRVPLIEPYEVVSPANSGPGEWFIIIKNHKAEGPNYFRSGDEFQFSSIKTIGILDSVIVATNENEYWPKLSGHYPSTLIIELKTNKQYLFSNQHHKNELNEKIRELEIGNIEMMEWNNIKNEYLANLKLPIRWNNQRTIKR
jgi:hypothetical protein